MGVPKAAFTVSGPLTGFDKPADSGNMVTRQFCSVCGSPVVSLNSGMPDMAMISASSLDDMEVFNPELIVYASREVSWNDLGADLPRFATMPPPEAMPGNNA
jgi:hypothetical protein